MGAGRREPGIVTHVSILIRPEGRMQQGGECLGWDGAFIPCFNPHPARRPDATPFPDRLIMSARPVSILIRPEGRMQPPAGFCGVGYRLPRFQSSSGQKAGCNTLAVCASILACWMFQSSSGQKAGCNKPLSSTRRTPSHVSILIRPEGRMQRAVRGAHRPRDDVVSILIRPEGRMQQ